MRHRRHRPLAPRGTARAGALAAALVVLLAAPLAAYTIYLKNGSTIMAKQKYTLRDGRAIITLLNGTQSSMDPALIDAARTEELNKSFNFSNATVIDSGTKPAAAAPAGRADRRLADLITSRGAATPRALPGARRQPAAEAATAPLIGRSGYAELSSLPRRPFANSDVAAELQQFFHLQQLNEVTVSSGTQKDRPLVDVSTNSEGSVFQALTTGANALLHVRDRFPGKVAALELVMTTPARTKAGQFVLTPELAADLVAKRVEATAFFVRHVQF